MRWPARMAPEASRPPKAIIKQIKTLADEGVKQITLVGQTINSYRFMEDGMTYTLADLLKMAAQVDGIAWIRFVWMGT